MAKSGSVRHMMHTIMTSDSALEIARIPEQIKGYGHVKERNLAAARERWGALMAQYRDAPRPSRAVA